MVNGYISAGVAMCCAVMIGFTNYQEVTLFFKTGRITPVILLIAATIAVAFIAAIQQSRSE